jgi:uncharacterized membrane protein
MPILTLYLATLIPFLALDAVMLTRVIAPLFRADLGEAVLGTPRAVPAILFYAGYIAGTVWIVGLPALKGGGAGQALWQGAILGAMAYGTYELTNLATLRDWTWRMTLTDLAWGTVLTAVAAAIGVAVTRWIHG